MTVAIIVGTRPEVIKMAPLYLQLRNIGIQTKLITTGQHTDLLSKALLDFGLLPDYNIDLNREKNSLSNLFSELYPRLESIFQLVKPRLVLVHGDTSSAATAALVAFNMQIPVGHIEAGLRSFDLSQPFPEEGNRRLIDSISTLKFAPTKNAYEALKREQGGVEGIFQTGNTIVDSIFLIEKSAGTNFRLGDTPYFLLTQHRRENFGKTLENIFQACLNAARTTGLKIIFPVHPNPNVEKAANLVFQNNDIVEMIKPVNYVEMLDLIRQSQFVVSDSGGIQEEAPYLDRFVLITREVTERPEAVTSGNAQLVGTNPKVIEDSITQLASSPFEFLKSRTKSPFGEIGASRDIAYIVKSFL